MVQGIILQEQCQDLQVVAARSRRAPSLRRGGARTGRAASTRTAPRRVTRPALVPALVQVRALGFSAAQAQGTGPGPAD